MRSASGVAYHIGVPTKKIEDWAKNQHYYVLMPYINASFQLQGNGRTGLWLFPMGSVNFAFFIGQFAETPATPSLLQSTFNCTGMESVPMLMDVDRGVPGGLGPAAISESF